MREIITMWRDVRMVVLTATVAAVFAAVLIPFKAVQILPGFVSIRPAEGLTVPFGLLFGPAGAWGLAIGNLIGDIFGGTLNPGSAFGFVANFCHGFLAYKLWGNLGRLSSAEAPEMRSVSQVAEYLVIATVTTTATAAILGWGMSLLGLFPFSVFATMAFVLSIIPSAIIGPAILFLIYPRIEKMGLRYQDILGVENRARGTHSWTFFSAVGISALTFAWFVLGITISIGVQTVPVAASLTPAATGQSAQLLQAVLGAVAFVLLIGLCWVGQTDPAPLRE